MEPIILVEEIRGAGKRAPTLCADIALQHIVDDAFQILNGPTQFRDVTEWKVT